MARDGVGHSTAFGAALVTLVGSSPAFRDVRRRVAAAAGGAGGILIRGPFGTGRRTVARAIHAGSDRRGQPLVFADGIVEAGPTGSGTLVLANVETFSPAAQASAVDAGRGGARLVATTAVDLSEAVDAGTFSGDLLDLLSADVIHLPPLRDRAEDVPDLCRHFLARPIEPAAVVALQRYPWPGNVWELENLLARAAVVETEPAVRAAVVEPWLRLPAADEVGATVEALAGKPLADIERRLILSTLQQFKGHRLKTAGALGIGVRTLGIKLKRWRDEGQLID